MKMQNKTVLFHRITEVLVLLKLFSFPFYAQITPLRSLKPSEIFSYSSIAHLQPPLLNGLHLFLHFHLCKPQALISPQRITQTSFSSLLNCELPENKNSLLHLGKLLLYISACIRVAASNIFYQ